MYTTTVSMVPNYVPQTRALITRGPHVEVFVQHSPNAKKACSMDSHVLDSYIVTRIIMFSGSCYWPAEQVKMTFCPRRSKLHSENVEVDMLPESGQISRLYLFEFWVICFYFIFGVGVSKREKKKLRIKVAFKWIF